MRTVEKWKQKTTDNFYEVYVDFLEGSELLKMMGGHLVSVYEEKGKPCGWQYTLSENKYNIFMDTIRRICASPSKQPATPVASPTQSNGNGAGLNQNGKGVD